MSGSDQEERNAMSGNDQFEPDATQGESRARGRIGFVEAIRLGFQRYIDFSGRSTRAEFWWWTLFCMLAIMIAALLNDMLGLPSSEDGGVLDGVVSLILLIPTLAVGARRLHDIGRSGWWQLAPYGLALAVILLTLVMVGGVGTGGVMLGLMIGAVASIVLIAILIFWWVKPSQPGTNRFGPNPFETPR